jgi:hypothetical protein
MATPYHRPGEDESDDEANPFNPNSSTDRIPLTQAFAAPDQRTSVPPYTTSPPIPYNERPASRYTLSESYVPPAQTSTTNLGGFGPGRVHFPDPSGGRPVSVMSNMTEDWIERQQPVQPSQADLRRYPTRRVRLNKGNVFTANYPYYHHFRKFADLLVFPVPSKMLLNQNGGMLSLAPWNSHICDVFPLLFLKAYLSRHGCYMRS